MNQAFTASAPDASKAATKPPSHRVRSSRRGPATRLTTLGETDAVDATPVLRFSPYAWAKLIWMRDRGDTEIGAFGISDNKDPLLVIDVAVIKQQSTWASVELDDEAVADYFDAQVDAGLSPQRFARIWLHTHPGDSAQPSGTDEQTFDRVFTPCDWAVMAIVAVGGETYARLRFNVGPAADVCIGIEVEFGCGFGGAQLESWEQEYADCVQAIDDHASTSLGHWWDEEPDWSDRMLDPYSLTPEAIEFIGAISPENAEEIDDGWDAWLAAQDETEVA